MLRVDWAHGSVSNPRLVVQIRYAKYNISGVRMTIATCRLGPREGLESWFGGLNSTCKVYSSQRVDWARGAVSNLGSVVQTRHTKFSFAKERMTIATCRLGPRGDVESWFGGLNSTCKV